MSHKTIVIAPHPDDEVFGVGGTILRRKAEGSSVAWLIVTGISVEHGWPLDVVERRESEINYVRQYFNFDEVFQLNLPAAQLDHLPMSQLVTLISQVFKSFSPNEVFMPHYSDIHSDHRVVFDAVASCIKWFRNSSVNRVLAYETLSETDFNVRLDSNFKPNYFINIDNYLERKIEIMLTYKSEILPFPFPRSIEAVRALAKIRGVASGYNAAEAFELLRERH